MSENWQHICEDLENVISPVNSNIEQQNQACTYQLPKIYCNTDKKKFNLFDRFSFVQLIEQIIRSKFKPNSNNIRNRGVIFEKFKELIDLSDPKCEEFIKQNEKSLLKLKNKRQLLLFLNKKFKKIHNYEPKITDSKTIYYKNSKSKSSIYMSNGFKYFSAGLVLIIIFIFMIIYIFFTSDLIELYFLRENSKHLLLLKFIKTIILAIMRN
jgi:hypothetical protein